MMSQELIDKVAEEVRAVLAVEDTRIGEVFRLLLDGKSELDIAEMYGSQAGWVYSYRRFITSLETGELPSALTVKRHMISKYRSFISRNFTALSPDVTQELQNRLAIMSAPSSDPPGDEPVVLILRKKEELAISVRRL